MSTALSKVAILATTLLGACTGLISSGSGGANGGTPEEQAAKQTFINEALPVLTTNCAGCHNGAQAGIGFLASMDGDLGIRDTLLAFDPNVVNLDAPQSSRLLTKGTHNGPALLADQASALLDWVNAEKAAVPMDGSGGGVVLVTAQFTPQICTGGDPGSATCPINTVDLGAIGATGATITFTAQAVSSGLYLNRLTVNGGPGGVYLEHPLFTSYAADGTPTVDSIDRFFSVKLDIMAAGTELLAGGQAGFVGFGAGPSDKLSISFKALSAYVPDTGTGSGSGNAGGGGGCKVLASFKTNAQGPLNTNCAGCHGGGQPNAKSAMDLSAIAAADDATLLIACNQVRTRINFQTTDLSGFYVAPNPGDPTNHPFKFNGVQADFNAFKAAVDLWVQAEKTAP